MSERRQGFLSYAIPLIEDDDIAAVVDSLKSNWVTKGPKTVEFERRFAEFVGTKHAIAVNSCTAGLHLALVAAGIGPGDEVITSPMTFASTANVVIHAGATPVFADIDPQTMNIDYRKLEEKITPYTKAIVPVHLAGLCCEMDEIMAIAEKHGLFVLEDCAHAVFSRYKNKLAGSIGHAGAFSFYATKNLVTGEGGMITTDDDDLADKIRVYSLHGMSRNAWNRYATKNSWFYEILCPGYKYNMTDIQAALGMTQLAKLDRMQKRREEIIAQYNIEFAAMPELEIPADREYMVHGWHLYIIRLNLDKISIDRNRFIEMLSEENIGTSVHFIPVHMHPYYAETFGLKPDDYPEANKAFQRIISLPLYPKMSDRDVNDVIQAVKRIIDMVRK